MVIGRVPSRFWAAWFAPSRKTTWQTTKYRALSEFGGAGMKTLPHFHEIKLQFIDLVCRDESLGDSAKVLAVLLSVSYVNKNEQYAWPSYDTLARELGGWSKKTVQRAVTELETNGWFSVRRSLGRGKTTTYTPSPEKISAAGELRVKADKIVAFPNTKREQFCLNKGIKLSDDGGQDRPPNKEKVNIPTRRSDYLSENRRRFVEKPIDFTFINEENSRAISAWNGWLVQNGFPVLEQSGLRRIEGRSYGYLLPLPMPPSDDVDQTKFIDNLARRIEGNRPVPSRVNQMGTR
jgi:hypothetical protein